MSDTFKTLEGNCQSVYRDKGSKFIAHVYPVETEVRIREILEALRKQYHDASHHCYAYRLGADGDIWRFNDDGEPSGSAGKPIYGQLLSFDISDVLVVVIRYFGGTKLGVPGLINAYRSAARDAINAGKIVDKIMTTDIRISFDYLNMNYVMRCVKDFSLEIVSGEYNNECVVVCRVRNSLLEQVKRLLKQYDDIETEELTTEFVA